MVASRFLIASLFICTFVSAATAAEVRTWTDTSGKTLTGTFVEVVDDDTVRIEADGKTYDIPISRFSNSDKQYIELQKANDTDSPSESPRRRRSNLKGWRQWTDSDGNEIRAKYVRMVDGEVVLLQGNIGHRVDFYKLSEEDQAYLRTELTAIGEEGSIPPKPVTPTAGNEGMNGGQGGNPSYTPPSITPQNGNTYEPNVMGNQAPAYAPPKTAAEIAAENAKIEEARRREAEKQEYAAQKQREKEEEDARRRKQEERQQQQQVANNSGPRFPQGMNNSSTPDFGGFQQEQVLVYQCTNCNKEIPDNLGAGDHCPHCGAFFQYEEDEFGRKTKEVAMPWYYSAPIPIGLIVWVVVAVIRRMGS